MVPIEAAADDTFHDQVIGGTGDANAHAEVEFPLRSEIYVNRGEELLLLLAQGIESGERSSVGLKLRYQRPSLRSTIGRISHVHVSAENAAR